MSCCCVVFMLRLLAASNCAQITVKYLSVSEVALYSHLLEILWFFVRQHVFRSKFFIIIEDLPAKIVRLLECPKKHLKLGLHH